MKKMLLTGMSGTGKSTVIRELQRRGIRAIDLDDDGWSHWIYTDTGLPAPEPAPGEYPWDELDWVWNEERIENLLTPEDAGGGPALVVAGTSENQGKFYPHLDYVVLLSAPAHVVMHRVDVRQNHPYGATPRTRARILEHTRILEHIKTVEPLLRRGATHEIDTTAPLVEVVERVITILDI